MKYYEVKARGIDKVQMQKMTIGYIVDIEKAAPIAEFGEAERLVHEDMAKYYLDANIATIKKAGITEVLGEKEGGQFYRCRVAFKTITEGETEKEVEYTYLVGAGSTSEAENILVKNLNGPADNYEIKSTSLDNISVVLDGKED